MNSYSKYEGKGSTPKTPTLYWILIFSKQYLGMKDKFSVFAFENSIQFI